MSLLSDNVQNNYNSVLRRKKREGNRIREYALRWKYSKKENRENLVCGSQLFIIWGTFLHRVNKCIFVPFTISLWLRLPKKSKIIWYYPEYELKVIELGMSKDKFLS